MMIMGPNKLFRCTFTGVDEHSSLHIIDKLSQKFPIVEWGVLLSTSDNRRINGNRYPTVEWLISNIPKLGEIANKTGASIALHVCGKETKLLLEQTKESIAMQLIPYVNRVQINFVYKEYQVVQLESLCSLFQNVIFITQQNKNNMNLYTKVTADNHQVLFDQSGGRGIISAEWLPALDNKVCGYAGGLGLDNIDHEIEKIKQVADKSFWIDMEGKIRTDDMLDLNICNRILEKLDKQTFIQRLLYNIHRYVMGNN